MRKVIFITLLTLISSFGKAQTIKNFIDQPYVETTAKVDTLVTPDKIYLSILISEQDTKGKISVEELENKMADKLRSIGIDLDKQLTLLDLGSNFKKYFLKKQDINKTKSYFLLVYNAKTAGNVIQSLEQIGISNVDLKLTEYSKMDQLNLILKSKAIRKAKLQADYLVEPLQQTVGVAIYISDKYSQNYQYDQLDEVVVAGYARKKKEYKSIDIEFKKIKVESQVNVRFKISQ